MEKKIYSLRTNVGYFYNRPIGYTKAFHQEYDEIFIQPDLNLKDLVVDFTLSRTREGLLMRAQLSAKVDMQCTRCLITYYATISCEFEELYAYLERYQNEIDEETVPEDGYIDFG